MITKFNKFLNEGKKEEKEKLRRKEETKYLSKDERKELDEVQRKELVSKRKYHGSMNDEDLETNKEALSKRTLYDATHPTEKED